MPLFAVRAETSDRITYGLARKTWPRLFLKSDGLADLGDARG
jgi:hypothetical protein